MLTKARASKNEGCKIRWHLKIQTDHLILARKPNFKKINKIKRTYNIVNFNVHIIRVLFKKRKDEEIITPYLKKKKIRSWKWQW